MPAFVGRYRSLEDSESSVVASSADSSTRELGVFTVPKPAAACIRTSLGVLPKKGQRVNQGGLSASIPMATRSCCITGHISEGTPTGEYIQIGGVEAYVAKPKEPSKEAIVISTDVFGHRLSNVQLIADAFAKDGFLTVVPDMFNGGGLPHWMLDALPKISGIPGDHAGPPSFFTRVTTILSLVPSLLWFNIRNRPATKVPILEAVIKEVKEKHGITKVGMIGYCYGGTPIFMIAKKEGVIDTFVVAHSQVSVPADIRTNKVPGLIIAAEADFAFPDKAREQAQEIIEKENLGENMRIKYFPGTFHGFAVRGDDKVELIKKAKEEAFYDASQWFKEHLK